MTSDSTELKTYLASISEVPEVVLFKQTTTSTNDDVKIFAKQGLNRVLVCSNQQTQGRGQHNRPWVSPQGNIYLSALVNTTTPLDGRFALEVALNILHMPCLDTFELFVKWPNDLYSTTGKWGGILVEPLSATQAIVGIGINLFAHTALQHIEQKTTALTQLGHLNCDKIEFIAHTYLAIQQAEQWFNHGSQNLAQRFNQSAMFQQQQVTLEHQNGCQSGLLLGIQNDGAICIQDDNRTIHTFYQGRLRPLTNTPLHDA